MESQVIEKGFERVWQMFKDTDRKFKDTDKKFGVGFNFGHLRI